MAPNPIAVTLADKVRFTPHPLVVPWTAKVEFDGDPKGRNSVALRLFDAQGKYLFQDQVLHPGYSLPGLLFSISPREKSIHIECLYLNSEVQRQGLGKAIIEAAIQAARRESLHKLTVIGDVPTYGYWTRVHGFFGTDSIRPDYLELHLH